MSYVPGGTNDARFAVQYHVALKGLQAGSLLGTFGIAPVVWFFSGRKKGRTLFSYVRSESVVGAGIMVPVSLVAGHLKLKDEPMSAIEDRAERISKNVYQQLCDKFAAFGGGIGCLVGAIGFRVSPMLGFAQGGGIGVGLGVLAYVAYSRTVDMRV